MYQIKITPLANEDLAGIVSYIADTLDNHAAAERLLRDITACYENLLQNPLMYERCREQRLKKIGYRKVVIRNYILIYRVSEHSKTIYIMRFFYGARDYETLL